MRAVTPVLLTLLGSLFVSGSSHSNMPLADSPHDSHPSFQGFNPEAPPNRPHTPPSIHHDYPDPAVEITPVHTPDERHAPDERRTSQVRPDTAGHTHPQPAQTLQQTSDPYQHPPPAYPAPMPDALARAHALHERFPSRVPIARLAQISSPQVRARTAELLHLHEAVRTAPGRRLRSHHIALANPAHRGDVSLIRGFRLSRGDMFALARRPEEADRVAFARRAGRERKALAAIGSTAGGAVAAAVGAAVGIPLAAARDEKCRTDPLRWPRSCSWGKWRESYERAQSAQRRGKAPGGGAAIDSSASKPVKQS